MPSVNLLLLLACGVLAAISAALAARLLRPAKHLSPATWVHTLACILPIAVAAGVLARWSGVQTAMLLLFACSVTALLFGLGFSILLSPHREKHPMPMQSPSAALVLPLACLLLLGGFRGQFSFAFLLALGITGILSLRVLYAEYPGKFSGRMLVIRILAALAPLLLLAWSVKLVILTHPVVFGAIPLELTLLVLLVPGLLLPSLRLAFYWNWRGDPHSVARILGSQALLCLGVLLPALVIGHAFWHGWHGGAMAITTLSPILWRLDGSLLLVAGFLLVGMRFDMLRPYHWVGMILLALYLAYLLLELTYRLA